MVQRVGRKIEPSLGIVLNWCHWIELMDSVWDKIFKILFFWTVLWYYSTTLGYVTLFQNTVLWYYFITLGSIWDKIFKNGPSNIYERWHLKMLKYLLRLRPCMGWIWESKLQPETHLGPCKASMKEFLYENS